MGRAAVAASRTAPRIPPPSSRSAPRCPPAQDFAGIGVAVPDHLQWHRVAKLQVHAGAAAIVAAGRLRSERVDYGAGTLCPLEVAAAVCTRHRAPARPLEEPPAACPPVSAAGVRCQRVAHGAQPAVARAARRRGRARHACLGRAAQAGSAGGGAAAHQAVSMRRGGRPADRRRRRDVGTTVSEREAAPLSLQARAAAGPGFHGCRTCPRFPPPCPPAATATTPASSFGAFGEGVSAHPSRRRHHGASARGASAWVCRITW